MAQDVRGRGDSEGVFEPFVNEARDGAETIEWAADLPFSNGDVVTYGFSYQGTSQLAAAARRPRGLRAVAPLMCAVEPYEMLYEGGCLLWEATARWAAQLATPELGDSRIEAVLDARPLLSALGERAPKWFCDWIAHEEHSYWSACAPDLSAVGVPVFTVLGYADAFAAPTARLVRLLDAEVVCGPWAHMPWGTRLGDLELPDASRRVAIDAFYEFLARILRDGGGGDSPRARYYSIGDGWHEAAGFPPRGGEWRLYATSAEGANSRHGDGRLSGTALAEALRDVIVSEPLVPHPGSGTPYPDVSSAEDRRDLLCYTSAPVEEPTDVAGSPRVSAKLVADAASFDLVASLTIVDGVVSRRVSFGAQRVGVQEGGTTVELELELGPVACRIAPGVRLRLDLSATCYPLYAANPQSASCSRASVRRGEHRVATIGLRAAKLRLPVVVEDQC